MRLRHVSLTAFVTLLLAVAGCGSLGLEEAQGFNDRAAYALGTHTAVLQATTRALNLGEISSDEAADVAELADRSRSLIDAAREVYNAGNEAEASQKLAIATSILQQLQAYLRGGPT